MGLQAMTWIHITLELGGFSGGTQLNLLILQIRKLRHTLLEWFSHRSTANMWQSPVLDMFLWTWLRRWVTTLLYHMGSNSGLDLSWLLTTSSDIKSSWFLPAKFLPLLLGLSLIKPNIMTSWYFSQVLIHCGHMWVPTAYVDYIFNILKGLLVYKTLKMDSIVCA